MMGLCHEKYIGSDENWEKARALGIHLLHLRYTLGGSFSRVQFTPDLLPSDVIGTQIYNMKEHAFDTKQGPIFSNFVLADEINRAPAKVQSALLEAMQERQVTIGEESYPLPKPFLVMATQNPVEQEGTYPLPEAQMDRFLLKVTLGYPTKEDELDIMRKQMSGAMEKLSAVVSLEQIVRARGFIERIYMDEKIENYILDIVFATREPQNYQLGALRNKISFGASPRGSIALAKAAKCHAFLRHRGFVTPDDVRAVAPAVLRHRIGLTYEAEAEELSTENIVTEILNTLMVP
jgi:MoxR-like ATPase